MIALCTMYIIIFYVIISIKFKLRIAIGAETNTSSDDKRKKKKNQINKKKKSYVSCGVPRNAILSEAYTITHAEVIE